MKPVTLSKVEKAFSHKVKFLVLSNIDIISCQVRTSKLFTKDLSGNEAAVFGYYDLIICYKNISEEKKHSYKAKVIKKAFCEIVPYEEIAKNDQENSQEVAATAVFLSQPSCRCNYENSDGKVLLQIDVCGEIKVTVILNGTKSSEEKQDIQKAEILLSDDNNNKKEQIYDSKINDEMNYTEDQIWQFEENDDISIEELMGMDWESLKLISEVTISSLI